MTKRRVALLTPIPGPYRLPFWNALNERCDLTVFFDSMSEPNRQWVLRPEDFRFLHRVLKGVTLRIPRRRVNLPGIDHRFLHLRFNLIPELIRLRPDVVVSGEMGLRTIQAALYCRLTRTPLVIWWEGTLHTEGHAGHLKSFVRRVLVRIARRFWTNGKESNALLRSYGADDATFDPGMTGIDAAALRDATKGLLPEREAIRQQLGVDGPTLLFLGSVSVGKGVTQLLDAMDAVYRTGARGWSVLFVGGGPLEGRVYEWADAHPGVAVVSTGFVQPPGLPRLFAAADAFVLPTLDDNWSLVAIEALAAGLPQIFSVYNGCVSDLAGSPEVGVPIDPRDAAAFAAALTRWISRTPPRISDEVAGPFVDYYGSQAQAERAFRSIEAAASGQRAAAKIYSSQETRRR